MTEMNSINSTQTYVNEAKMTLLNKKTIGKTVMSRVSLWALLTDNTKIDWLMILVELNLHQLEILETLKYQNVVVPKEEHQKSGGKLCLVINLEKS